MIAASDQFGGYQEALSIGCIDCPFAKTRNICSGSFHLCSTLELYAYAINVAKDMGWVSNSKANFWSTETNIDIVQSDAVGTALCCKNIEYA